MSQDTQDTSPRRREWTAPVLEQLTVDLDAIASGNPATTDKSPGAHTPS